LVEYFSDRVFPRVREMGYSAVRTERWKYVHYWDLQGADELYDLQRDPFELENRAGAEGPRVTEMRGVLRELMRETGDERAV
jgi:N-acetylglucosamine-6-sulfatase